MEFSVKERLVLLGMLNGFRGNITALKLVDEFGQALSFDDIEHKKLSLRTAEGGAVMWDMAAEVSCVKSIEVSDTLKSIIGKALRKLNSEEQLTYDHVGLYERFVGDE